MSLFDNIMDNKGAGNDTQQTESSTDSNPATDGANQPSWWWDKNTPGSGERPEWLPEKYRSAEDTARAFKELEKRLGTAPDQYDWSKGENWIEPDYMPFKELADYAKSKHVTQDVFDKMLESVGQYLDEFKIDYNEEKQALGENAEERLRVLNNWAQANLSEDSYHALTSNLRTADAIKALEELRSKMIQNNTTIPTGNEVSSPSLTMEEVQLEIQENLEKYKNNPQYRKEIQRKISSIADQSSYVDKNY